MRKLIKKMTEWIHISLIMAIIIPLLYALVIKQPDSIGHTLYLKCLVIVFPIMATDLAIDKCRGLLSYLILCVLIFAVTQSLSFAAAFSIRRYPFFLAYMILMACETLFLTFSRLAERLHNNKMEDASNISDPTWQPSDSILEKPSFPVLIYFLGVYFIAVNFNNASVCNAALCSVIIYAPVTLLYQYLCETETYLALNKRTCNLPSKRIYGIGSGMLAIFLLLLMIATLPAILTISERHYRDLREWNDRVKIDAADLIPEKPAENTGEDPMEAFMKEYGEIKPAPQWITVLFYIIETAITFLLIALAFRAIHTVFRNFRAAYDENGDIVEELEETKETITKIAIHTNRHQLSRREIIRKEYRKTIRRYRKDRPAVYESPTEIETIAGIADSEEGKALHQQYELARYGRDTDGRQ